MFWKVHDGLDAMIMVTLPRTGRLVAQKTVATIQIGQVNGHS